MVPTSTTSFMEPLCNLRCSKSVSMCCKRPGSKSACFTMWYCHVIQCFTCLRFSGCTSFSKPSSRIRIIPSTSRTSLNSQLQEMSRSLVVHTQHLMLSIAWHFATLRLFACILRCSLQFAVWQERIRVVDDYTACGSRFAGLNSCELSCKTSSHVGLLPVIPYASSAIP